MVQPSVIVPGSSRGKSYDKDRSKRYDEILKSTVANNGCKFIELFEVLDKSDFMDGLHQNENGHKKMYQVIRQRI